ncbi:MAG: spore coat protein CotH [Lachnospiraceae bacterium]|nr:spore coat protein CotH [Lachnospiraceae bacterium]
MSTHRHFEKFCFVILSVCLLLTFLSVTTRGMEEQTAPVEAEYENRLFDTSSVHTIDIIMEDWDSFIDTCTDETYSACALIIDGEVSRNVAIRAKGNTSLTQVAAYGNDRYSFKIEFDHYDCSKTYYGLDKLCLNNIIQDNTYMKEYLVYQMMAELGAPAPLCSYVNISVNGNPWGLYLAVEGIEEAFLRRNYGSDYGELYKPDSTSLQNHPMRPENLESPSSSAQGESPEFPSDALQEEHPGPFSDDSQEERPDIPSDSSKADLPGSPFEDTKGARGEPPSGNFARENVLTGDSDVLLQYIDSDPDSYPNIFDNAKTDVSDKDKKRLVEALRRLGNGEDLEQTVAVDSVIRYFVVHNFVLNFDSYTGSMIHNYYLYEQDGQLSMLPWDYNLAFGGFESAGGAEALINYPIDTPVSGGAVDDRPMIAWIFSDEIYTDLYHQYFSELLSGYFESGRFAEMIDSTTALIAPYVETDPTKFCTYEAFLKGADTLKTFCLLRAESIRGQLDGSIGRTSDTQNQETFITAGDLTVSDMGSMNHSDIKPSIKETGTAPIGSSDSGLGSDSDTTSMGNSGSSLMRDSDTVSMDSSDADLINGSDTAPVNSSGLNSMNPPGDFPQISREGTDRVPEQKQFLPLLLTGLSALILLGGLLVARLFKPRL